MSEGVHGGEGVDEQLDEQLSAGGVVRDVLEELVDELSEEQGEPSAQGAPKPHSTPAAAPKPAPAADAAGPEATPATAAAAGPAAGLLEASLYMKARLEQQVPGGPGLSDLLSGLLGHLTPTKGPPAAAAAGHARDVGVATPGVGAGEAAAAPANVAGNEA